MHGYGGVDQLYYEDVDEPRVAQPDEVVVRLKAAAINHIDIWNRMGATAIAFEMPHILGADGAGIVVEVGENVANVKEGDAVGLYPPSGCGRCEFCLTDRDVMCIRCARWASGSRGPTRNL
jgi:NADPH:quinone reductase-like Zn-dependent oxidoreductase